MSTISGDVLLTSAFMAYAGYFDQVETLIWFMTFCYNFMEMFFIFSDDFAL